MKIMLEDVRMAFPALYTPQSIGDGEPAYGARFIIEPGSENAKKIEAAIQAVAADKWADKAKDVLAVIDKNDKSSYLREPYASKKTGEVFSGFEGKYSLGTRTPADKPRPSTFDRSKREVGPNDGVFYGGCYVDASVDIWAQDNTYGRRINASLLGVRFWRDGDAFSGSGPARADDFADREGDGGELV